jgi:hypothetical protein
MGDFPTQYQKVEAEFFDWNTPKDQLRAVKLGPVLLYRHRPSSIELPNFSVQGSAKSAKNFRSSIVEGRRVGGTCRSFILLVL